MVYNSANDPNKSNGYQRSRRIAARASKGVAVTPSDTVDLTSYASGLVVTSIAGGANLKVIPAQNADADTVTFTGVTVGFIVPYQVRRVFATGTTASVATLDS